MLSENTAMAVKKSVDQLIVETVALNNTMSELVAMMKESRRRETGEPESTEVKHVGRVAHKPEEAKPVEAPAVETGGLRAAREGNLPVTHL